MRRGGDIATGRIYVLDTTAFLAALPLMLYNARLMTPPRVVEEVRDRESRERLQVAMLLDRVEVVEPRERYRWRVKRTAVKHGLHGSLSETDIDVAALALQARDEHGDVIVVTDDYALQELLTHLGMRFQPLRTRGIREVRDYILVCPVCGYVSKRFGEKVCPRCGVPLVRRRKAK